VSTIYRGRKAERQAYSKAKMRCDNPNHPRYMSYGGRGIKFLFESFDQFMDEVGPRPPGKTSRGGRALYSIHRINNNGNYEPGNVKWATDKEQHAPGAFRRPRVTCPRPRSIYSQRPMFQFRNGTGHQKGVEFISAPCLFCPKQWVGPDDHCRRNFQTRLRKPAERRSFARTTHSTIPHKRADSKNHPHFSPHLGFYAAKTSEARHRGNQHEH
jgi:hypothetical protein